MAFMARLEGHSRSGDNAVFELALTALPGAGTLQRGHAGHGRPKFIPSTGTAFQ
jgi:hypothetical protein